MSDVTNPTPVTEAPATAAQPEAAPPPPASAPAGEAAAKPANRPENRGGRDRAPRGPERGREDRPRGDRREGRPPEPRPGDAARGDRRDRDRDRRPEPAPDIDYDKLVTDSLYLDNQAHAIVARMRDLDSGTRSQLRRLYGAVRRAVRTPQTERQHEFVMLRARLAYTIARHSLRSLDGLEKLLLQVTRKNDLKGYERFRDLFEAIIAYHE
jgi:CRISPR type III-A-associated protein Csm2